MARGRASASGALRTVQAMDVTFKEIEHKYVVGDDFDLADFRAKLTAMNPVRHATLHVRDRYFITEAGRARGFVLRHRFDQELHELTLKSVGADAEVRDEINLKLRAGDQQAEVDAFVAAQGLLWQGTLWKDLEVWHFPDCEAVFYVAKAEHRVIRCVEFEATVKPSREEALAIVHRYEEATGFAGAQRTPESLLALLWPASAGQSLHSWLRRGKPHKPVSRKPVGRKPVGRKPVGRKPVSRKP
jgi:hypothetical protein